MLGRNQPRRLTGSRLAIIARAVSWIRARYDQTIHIEDLAHDIGMSVSSLNLAIPCCHGHEPTAIPKAAPAGFMCVPRCARRDCG